jgi:hypothetical protein
MNRPAVLRYAVFHQPDLRSDSAFKGKMNFIMFGKTGSLERT